MLENAFLKLTLTVVEVYLNREKYLITIARRQSTKMRKAIANLFNYSQEKLSFLKFVRQKH